MSKTPFNDNERSEMSINLDGTDERISIIVVHNDRPEYLSICLQTLLVTCINNNFELIVVDNGSKSVEAQAYLDELEEDGVKVIRNDENLFWTKAANLGAKAADKNSKYLVFLHYDMCILNPVWLDLLINVSEKNKSGVVGYYMEHYTVPGTNQRMGFVHECCLLVTRECWKDCGPFNDELPQIGAPFIFNLVANTKGYSPQVVSNEKYVHHYESLTLDLNDYERLAEQAQATFPKLLMQLQKSNS